MSKIRIAQIGVGHDHALEILRSIREQTEYFDVVAYGLPEEEKIRYADRLPKFDGLEERRIEDILADPTVQAVTIETEERNLIRYALMAVQAGKHIHVDKPGGTDPAEFEQLIHALKEKQLVFSLGYMYRYNQAVEALLRDIQVGKLGEIYSVEAHMSCWHKPEKRQWLEAFPGGMMFYLGCHLIDLIYRIQGKPEQVLPLNCCTGADGVTADDYGMAVLKYKNGVSFAKTCAVERGGFERRQIVVCGTKGTVELRPLEVYGDFDGLYTGVRTATSKKWHEPSCQTATQPEDRYDRMMRSFSQMVNGEIENPYTYDYEYELYKLVMQCCGRKAE